MKTKTVVIVWQDNNISPTQYHLLNEKFGFGKWCVQHIPMEASIGEIGDIFTKYHLMEATGEYDKVVFIFVDLIGVLMGLVTDHDHEWYVFHVKNFMTATPIAGNMECNTARVPVDCGCPTDTVLFGPY